MTAAHTAALQDVLGEASPLDLSSDPLPAIAINLDDAEILAANASGAEALGIFPYASFPIALDPAMPAIERLRQIVVSHDVDVALPQALTFWNNGHQQPVRCRMSRYGKKDSRIFLLHVVSAEMNRDTAAMTPPPQDNGAASPAPPASKVPAPQSPGLDIGALKEIARRIREGDLSAPAAGQQAAAGASASAIEEQAERQATQHPASAPFLGGAQRKVYSMLDPDHLAKLAHELKTPLTAIAAAAEVMRDERLGAMGNERYLSYAGDIHESATHALDVITSLLSESGRPGAAPSRLIALDLHAIVSRTVSSMQALAESRGLTLAFDAGEGQPHVVANPTAVRQILLNLLTNAIKFTPHGGQVRVAIGYLDDGRVYLAVRDTGRGMNGKQFAATGTPSPASSLNPSGRGQGIGLPLVRRLVHEMGADIEIDSAPQKGTVVLIAFGGHARWQA